MDEVIGMSKIQFNDRHAQERNKSRGRIKKPNLPCL